MNVIFGYERRGILRDAFQDSRVYLGRTIERYLSKMKEGEKFAYRRVAHILNMPPEDPLSYLDRRFAQGPRLSASKLGGIVSVPQKEILTKSRILTVFEDIPARFFTHWRTARGQELS